MRPVNVDKDRLLTILRENRSGHRAIFEEALEGYRAKALELFNAELDKIKAGKKFRAYVHLSEPSDHTADYDAVIGMLEMTTDTTVELDEASYRHLVLDEWEWKKQFLGSNALYSSTAAGLMANDDD